MTARDVIRNGEAANGDRLLPRLKEVFQAQIEHIVVFHDGSFGISARWIGAKRATFAAICAIARSVNASVIVDRLVKSLLQFQCMFERAKLDIGSVITTALAVISATAKRMVIARAINGCSAYDAKRSMSAQGMAFLAAESHRKYSR